MATTKTIQAIVKNRTDTAANWTQKNPVLAEGEIIVVQTSAGETRLKIGDGVKTFTQLPYTDEQIYNNVVTSVNGQTGDVTLNIPGGASSMKKLTFTGMATGEYDGTTDVNIDVPSDVYVVPTFETESTFDADFDELVNAIKSNKILVLPEDRNTIIIFDTWFNFDDLNNIKSAVLCCMAIGNFCGIIIDKDTKKVTTQQFEIPMFESSTLEQNSGSVYWDKDTNKYIIKDISSASGSSSDYVINVTLDTKQSSIGNWVLGYSCTCDKTYAEVLVAYQSGAKVIAHVTRNKEITLSDGSKKTIPIINEAPLTRYIAAQNLLVFDYVHNATDLSVSSGGLTYTTGDSGDSMICYVATYQFAFGTADTSADSVQIPTTTKVQDMINTSVGDINTNTYTIQVSNTAPPVGTSDKIITYVVEETTNE